MSARDDGGNAFPFACQGPTTAPEIYYGASLRDYFAAKAMQGFCVDDYSFDKAAEYAYKQADAMLKARGEA